MIVEQDGTSRSLTYAELSARSDQVAGWLQANGIERGERIVLMLGNQIELWEIILAAIKIGAVIIPASTLLTPTDLADRVHRGGARFVVARDVDAPSFREVPGTFLRIAVGRPVEGWIEYDDSTQLPGQRVHPGGRVPARPTRCCCTSPPAPRRCPNSLSTARSRTRSGI